MAIVQQGVNRAPRISDGAAAPQSVMIGTSISHTVASSFPLKCDAGRRFRGRTWKVRPLYSRYERGSMCFHGRLSRSTPAGMGGISQRWVVGAACGLGILLVTAPKTAQAIDCQKAATNVEHAICRDTGESAPPAGSSTNSRVAACKGLLDRYRPLANTHPGERPLTVLAQAGAAGFELTGHGDTMLHPGSDLVSWAKGQQPPVTISAQLSESLASDGNGGMLQKAPGMPFLMLSRLEGSAACDSSVFILMKDGVALLSRRPFDDAEDNCPNGGVFASLDSVPLYVRQNYDYQPGMQASLEVATWQADHFEAACTVSLSYRPWVSAKTLNSSEDSCEGTDCEDLRKAAFELVKAKITGTASVESLLRGLTAQQRERYQAEQSAAEGQPDAGASENVVFVPYVRQGEVYVARIADRTIGWRDYADQSVKFERLEDGKITEKAAFAVGVWKGELENATVESTP